MCSKRHTLDFYQPVRSFLGSPEKYMTLLCTQESEVAGEVTLVLLRQFLARAR